MEAISRRIGVEEEFLLARSAAGGLAAEAEDVLGTARDRHEPTRDEAEPFAHELKQEQVELGTSPHATLDDLEADLVRLRSELASAAAHRGARLIASGTSPIDAASSTTEDERYERMTDEFGVLARQQLTCGMHVHVSIDSADEGVAVLDRLRPWLAVLTALSANSPLHAGRDTGYASYRSVLWRQWPTAGSVDPFGDVAGYERACADLITSGAALDDGMIYFDARLSAVFPTAEVRVADVVPWVADAVTIAALARALVEQSARDWRANVALVPVRTDLLRAAAWRACRSGMTGVLVDTVTARAVPAWELVAALLERVEGALSDYGDLDRVRNGLERIRQRGTGAELQRRAFATAGRPDDVIATLSTQLTT